MYKRQKKQHADESDAQRASRIAKHKATKSTPEWKAEAAVWNRQNRQIQVNAPDFVTKRNSRREKKLELWRKIAVQIPLHPRDRIVGKKYIDSKGVLYVAQACKGQAPVLRRLGMEAFERDRLRFAKCAAKECVGSSV